MTRSDAASLVGVVIIAILIWIAATLDTEAGVYPSPSTTVDIGTAKTCILDAGTVICFER